MLYVSIIFSLFHKTVFKGEWDISTLLPAIVFDHVGKLNNKFSFLIFLTALKGMFVFPPERGLTVLTVDVRDCMQAGEKDPLLGRATAHVHHGVEEVGSSLAALKRLRDQLIVIGQVGSAVDTAVCSVTAWQISLESFGLGHLHHVCCTFLTQLRADAGRAAALPDSVTKETLENAHKSRCCLGQRVALSTQLG